jgi:uncharacterized protein YabN with tetrapyrrole methylase and pyrophosphatase domain
MFLEQQAKANSKDIKDMTLSEMEHYWQQAKKL